MWGSLEACRFGVAMRPSRSTANHPAADLSSDRKAIERPEPSLSAPEGINLDAAYDHVDARELVDEYGLTPHIRSRGEEIKLKARTPGWRARRWAVEACRCWLNRNRAIPIRRSKKDENHLALLQLYEKGV